MAVQVRIATADDADLLRAWANDPMTRNNSFNSGQIDRSTHERWLAARLASTSTRLLIGLENGEPIGMVRLEMTREHVAEVNISVAPEVRGRGLGRTLLSAGLAAAGRDSGLEVRTFEARIRPENLASIALFEGAGFRLRSRGDCDGVPCLMFERDG